MGWTHVCSTITTQGTGFRSQAVVVCWAVRSVGRLGECSQLETLASRLGVEPTDDYASIPSTCHHHDYEHVVEDQ